MKNVAEFISFCSSEEHENVRLSKQWAPFAEVVSVCVEEVHVLSDDEHTAQSVISRQATDVSSVIKMIGKHICILHTFFQRRL